MATTLPDAVAAPLAVWVGFWPFRVRIEFAPLTLADAGAYERSARRRRGVPDEPRLLCFLSARRADPGLTWGRFRRRSFGQLRRCLAAVRLVNAELFLKAKPDGGESGGSAAIDFGALWRKYIITGWPPATIANMTFAQLAMYDATGKSGEPAEPPKWGSVAEWRKDKVGSGEYEKIRGKGAT